MRGLTLLCLLGLFLTASTAWLPGSIFPMRTEHTFNITTNTTTNSSMESEVDKPDNTSVQATQLPVENAPGFPPPTAADDTQG
ncbi:hypothetical protein VZT92_014129 [Zoarces viviparus]|uniref:CD45 n=1 Tax=Zoarces viviparus TaxID=48416 RepID=A0AAW1F084_ZOAVI